MVQGIDFRTPVVRVVKDDNIARDNHIFSS